MGLIPREEKYFTLLSQMAAQVKQGGEIFAKVFEDYQNLARYAEQVKAVEVECDEMGAKITQKLNSSFITPIDREDIFLLANELDDVIDMITDLARRLDIFSVSRPRPESLEIARILCSATAELADVFALLDQERGVGEHLRNIKQLEKRGDALYREAIRRLFKEEKDPIEVIKWMSIFEELENSIDRCKDVAEALEAVVVKNK
jgi:uncharacterized protein